MLRQFIFSAQTGLFKSHLPSIFNHCERLGYFVPLYNKWLHKLKLSHNPVILTGGLEVKAIQSGIIVEFSCVQHHTKTETHQLMSARMQAIDKGMFYTEIVQAEILHWIIIMHNVFTTSFNKTICGSILNFIKIYHEIFRKMSAQVSDFSYNCDLE